MPQLIVRNLEEKVVAKLRQRAAANNRSVEAEHRELLRTALLGAEARRSFKQALADIPAVGCDEDFARDRSKPRKVRL